ncbi:MAG: hypothetical protein KQ78_01493 [Candidatus Izimaplasma bacterium HR2]|nr:MAG: hypothetical protein KQ78_01493 [Candidatus Izimaplasma bacterium HR2]
MDKEQHLLIKLAEECTAVSKAVHKAALFGMEDGYPGTNRTNLEDVYMSKLYYSSTLCKIGQCDKALDIIYDNIEELISNRNYSIVDHIFLNFPIMDLDSHLIVGLLATTKYAKDRLKYRSYFVKNSKSALILRNEFNKKTFSHLV